MLESSPDRYVLPFIWMFAVAFFGFFEIIIGTFVHRFTIPSWRQSYKASFNDCHLFIFSIGTCGGIIGTIICAFVAPSTGPSTTLQMAGRCIAFGVAVLIILFSAVLWALTRSNAVRSGVVGSSVPSGLVDLGKQTAEQKAEWAIGLSKFSMVSALVIGLIAEFSK